MIKRGKYFSPPPKGDLDFKELIQRAASLGVGRAVGGDGFPPGPWTPELLAEAIAQFDTEGGVDVRTVQFWFQDGDKGVSPQNIRWLARVFGCDDPIATGEWQAELSAAKVRLLSRRRERRKAEDGYAASVATAHEEASRGDLEQPGKFSSVARSASLAQRVENMFLRYGPLNLPIIVWSGCAALWFLAYVTGTHTITYSPLEGLTKQVGFFWSVSWNIGEMLAIPIYIISVSELLSFWKSRGRPSLISVSDGSEKNGEWSHAVDSTSSSHWAILGVCSLLIFFLQWLGVYLLPLLSGSTTITMVDWILVANHRPEIVSKSEAISISLIAFLYSGVIYWFFFSGMLLAYTVAKDYSDVLNAIDGRVNAEAGRISSTIGVTVLVWMYRCAVFGACVAICLKLNATYLVTNSSYLSSWLVGDALAAIGIRADGWDWIGGNPSPFFTSFLLLLINVSVFTLGSANLMLSVRRKVVDQKQRQQITTLWGQMIGVMTLLCLCYAVIGAFVGFSIILAGSVIASLVSLWWVSQVGVEGEEVFG